MIHVQEGTSPSRGPITGEATLASHTPTSAYDKESFSPTTAQGIWSKIKLKRNWKDFFHIKIRNFKL